MRRRNDPIQFV